MLTIALPAHAKDSASLTYEKPCNKNEKLHYQNLKETNLGKIVVEHINEEFNLPHAVAIKFICDHDNDSGPYYDPDNRSIIVPYSFREYVFKELVANEYSDSQDELNIITDDVVLHTLYHELGHALVDILELPITGKEEDAVDELSTLLLLESYEDGDEVSISAGEFFDIESMQNNSVEEEELFGAHSLDEQRFFNIICLVYGSDPEKYNQLMTELGIDEDRQELCVEDFDRRSVAWNKILKNYRK